MRRIASFYYLSYPDSMPDDPLRVHSEVYVEVGGEGADCEHFEETYAFHVYTRKCVNELLDKDGLLVSPSTIIVDRFDDTSIKCALESVLENIEDYGIKKD